MSQHDTHRYYEPIVLRTTMMMDIGDCGIACLEMLSGKSYADVLAVCPKRGKPTQNGLTTRQLYIVARRLGIQLRAIPFTRNSDLEHVDDEIIGILDISRGADTTWEGHYVIYANRMIYNPAENLWWRDVQAFMRLRHWTAHALHYRIA